MAAVSPAAWCERRIVGVATQWTEARDSMGCAGGGSGMGWDARLDPIAHKVVDAGGEVEVPEELHAITESSGPVPLVGHWSRRYVRVATATANALLE